MKFFKLTILTLFFAIAPAVFFGCGKVAPDKNLNENGNENLNTNENTNLNQNTNTNIATTTAKIDTSDWLTYRNEEYGFSVKYPEGWEVDENLVKYSDNEVFISGVWFATNQSERGLSFWIKNIKPDSSLKQWFSFNETNRWDEAYDSYRNNVIKIDDKAQFLGKSAIIAEKISRDEFGLSYNKSIYFLYSNNLVFELSANVGKFDDFENKFLLNEMINSFSLFSL